MPLILNANFDLPGLMFFTSLILFCVILTIVRGRICNLAHDSHLDTPVGIAPFLIFKFDIMSLDASMIYRLMQSIELWMWFLLDAPNTTL